MVNIKVVDNVNDFHSLKSDWLHIQSLQGEGESYIFQSFEWTMTWWDSFGKNRSLYIVTAYDENEKVIGIVPLMLTRKSHRGLPVQALSFIENGNSLHNDFIFHPEFKSEIIEALATFLKTNKQWHMMELNNIPSTSQVLQVFLDALKKNGMLNGIKAGLDSPFVRIDKNWDEYYVSRSPKARKTLRSITNRIKAAGESMVCKYTTFKEYEEIKSELYSIAEKSWSHTIGDSLCSGTNAIFFDSLSKAMSENGGLIIWMLKLNNEFVAFEYHITDNNRVYGLRSSYKSDFKALSPGVFLDSQIMESYFKEKKVSEYDLGGANDFYKHKWSDEVRTHLNLSIYNKSLYSIILYIYEEIIISFIKKFTGRKKEGALDKANVEAS